MEMRIMNMMRRLICFLLVMVMTLSVACPALADSPSGKPSYGSNPKTGDQIMMYVIIMLIAMAALAVVLLFSRKFFGK